MIMVIGPHRKKSEATRAHPTPASPNNRVVPSPRAADAAPKEVPEPVDSEPAADEAAVPGPA